jgi:putative DNA primase/helicase
MTSVYTRHGAGRPRGLDELAANLPRVIPAWRYSGPTRRSSAEWYFIRRGVPWLVECQWIRFDPNCPHPLGLRAPAVIALLLDPHDNVGGLHKMFITADGNKSALEPRRSTIGSVAGNAIHIGEPAQQIVVAEGLETAASAGVLLNRPAWAACGAGNLAYSMRLPALPLASDVVIAVDADLPGRRAARRAAVRWRAEGRTVHFAMPERAGADFNNILLDREEPS